MGGTGEGRAGAEIGIKVELPGVSNQVGQVAADQRLAAREVDLDDPQRGGLG